MDTLKEKVALITGGASGIGKEICLLFSKEGAKVRVVDWDEKGAGKTAQEIRSAGNEASFLRADVSISSDVKNMVEDTVNTYGCIDILVNNAGIEQVVASVEDISEEDWDRVISINLRGVFLGMKYCLPYLVKSGGVVVNTASTASLVGQPYSAAYAASKGGIIQLTKSAAVEYASKNVRINCICPGAIDTPHLQRVRSSTLFDSIKPLRATTPMARLGKPEEVARAALFLANRDASFITGTGLIIDGGLTAL